MAFAKTLSEFPVWCWFPLVFAGSMNPLCVLHLDDPQQRFNTSALKNTTNPAWDQPFILWVLPQMTANWWYHVGIIGVSFVLILINGVHFCNACSLFTTSELNGLSKELNIQLMNDGQTPESKKITDCLLPFNLHVRQMFGPTRLVYGFSLFQIPYLVRFQCLLIL